MRASAGTSATSSRSAVILAAPGRRPLAPDRGDRAARAVRVPRPPAAAAGTHRARAAEPVTERHDAQAARGRDRGGPRRPGRRRRRRASEVTLFGHPTRIPNGPATLAVTHRTPIIVGRCLRDRAGPLQSPRARCSRCRTAAIAAPTSPLLTQRLAERLEHDIAAAPEQWWGAFQPFWPDLGA